MIISLKVIKVIDYFFIIIEDKNDWKKIEKRIECWIKEIKKFIIIKLIIIYKKIKKIIIDISDDNIIVTKKIYIL